MAEPAGRLCNHTVSVALHALCVIFVSPQIDGSCRKSITCVYNSKFFVFSLEVDFVDMLSPVTAAPDKTIWKRIKRASFESSVAQLNETKPIPETRDYSADDVSIPRNGYPLPFDVERQLADDFAFFAAYESGVDYVSAATVCATTGDIGLTVSLAANEGIATCVEKFFKDIFVALENCAQKRNTARSECLRKKMTNVIIDIRREDCIAIVFSLIVKLHLRKILVRLGFRRPNHERAPPRGHLALRLKSLLNTFGSARKSSETRKTIMTQLDTLQSLADEVKARSISGDAEPIKATIKKAFEITSNINNRSLDSVLVEMGGSKRDLDNRAIRDLKKLANYWRVCAFLSEMCRSYRPLFSVIRLKVLEHFHPTPSALSSGKLYVHAEIQIISYYESGYTGAWPRAIGTSKEACFLCDAFISAHGLFHVSKAHRQVFAAWTVPDIKEYNLKAVERLRASIRQTKRKIEEETRKEKAFKAKPRPGQQRQGPLLSSVNLNDPLIPAGSVTSVTTQSSLPKPIASTAAPHLSSSSSSTSTVKLNSRLSSQSDGPGQVIITPETPFEITLDELTLYTYFDGPDPSHGDTVGLSRPHDDKERHFSKGSVSVDRDLGFTSTEYIDLSNLPYGKDRIVRMPTGAHGHSLTFTLGSGEKALMNVTCKWHR